MHLLSNEALSCGLHLLNLLHQWWNDIKKIAHDSVIRDFEDGSLGVLIHCHDCARAFHAHDMLNGAADTQRKIKFGSNSLSGRTDLAIHRKPSGVANWTGGGDLATDSLGKLFCNFDVFLFFDSPSHRHDDSGLRKIHGLLGFLEDFLGLISDETVGNVHIHRLDRSSTGPHLNLIPAESTILKGNKPRRIRGEAYVSGELALEHL